MKKLKKVVALLLVAMMILSMVACGKSKESEEDEYETIVTEEWVEVEGETTGEEGEQQGNGTQGQTGTPGKTGSTSTLASNKAFLESLKGFEINIYTQRAEKPTRGTASGNRYYAILAKVAKKYGCTINVKTEGVEGLQQSILGGKPLANVISLQDYNTVSWLNAGVAADLTQAMKETGITFKEDIYNKEITEFFKLNGKQYMFSSDIYEPYMLFYNKRLVQEAGLADPIELYNAGTWSFDKLEEYLKKLKKTSNDGTTLVAGVQSTTLAPFAEVLTGMNGASLYKLQDGTLVSNLGDSKTKQSLEYLRRWCNELKIAGPGGANWTDFVKNFAAGKTAMVLGTKYVAETISGYNMKDAIGCVPFPYGPSSNASQKVTYGQFFPTFIPKSEEKNATKILFVMNEVYKELYSVRETDFTDNYRALIRDNNSYNIFKKLSLDSNAVQMNYIQVAGILWGDYMSQAQLITDIAGGTAVQTAINTYESAIKVGLSEQWGKWEIGQ